jgi:small GTP-binding protein
MNKSAINLISCKIVIVGEAEVGKSSIIQHLTKGEFTNKYRMTANIEVTRVEIKIPDNNTIVDFYIHDIPGASRIFGHPKEIMNQIYKDSKYVVFVTDNTTNSLSIESWIENIQDNAGEIPSILISNKEDISNLDESKLAQEKIMNYCGHRSFKHFVTSAKTGKGIREAFEFMANEVARNNSNGLHN